MSARKDIIFPSYMLINPLMYSADKDSFVEGWDKLSPSLTLAGTGIDNESNYTLPAREDTLKRFRVSVASIQAGTGPTVDKLLELDTANLYYGVKGGAGSTVPIGGAASSTLGTLANGLPVKFQKIHFFASQYQGAFKEGPAIDATETSMSSDPVEYCCYMLCSSPVKVNRAPHPISSTLDSANEGAEQTKAVVDWMPDGDFAGRLTIGGAPLTKIEILTGVEAISGLDGIKLRLKKGFVYGGFPTSNADMDIPLDTGHDDIYDRLDCICNELSQLTGTDGTYLGNCCSTTTTTTTTTTPAPPEYLADKWYCVRGLLGAGTPTCTIGASILEGDVVGSGPYDSEIDCTSSNTCDCSAAGIDETKYYVVTRRIGFPEEETICMLGSEIVSMAEAEYWCPFEIVSGPHDSCP